MSIETEITRISTNVSDTLSAVSEMGGEVPEGATSNDMAAGVRSIPVGAKIDDTTPSSTTVYSSQKIESVVSALNEANAAQDKEIAKKANDSDLAVVAKSGSYNDLTNKPTIPTVPTALKNPNKLTFKGAVTAEYDGSTAVEVTIPEGVGNDYTLPIASATQLGGVQPVAKTDEMTQAVGVDNAGGLWTKAGSGSGTGGWEYIGESTPDSQLTFESGKYKLFYVKAYFERESATNDFMRIHVDGSENIVWVFSSDAKASVAGLIVPGHEFIGEYGTNVAEYFTHLSRKTQVILTSGENSASKGTTFWKTNYGNSPTNFGIKLWGMA